MLSVRLRRPLLVPALALTLAMALAGLAAVSAASAQSRVPTAPDRWVTDQAGFLAPETVARLDARLQDYERQTGHQLLVWIGRTFGEGTTPEEFAVKAFEAWKVGRKGMDDGLVLFIFAEDRKIKIEVGYGLEGVVPDIYAYRVINNILVPGIRAGRPDQAVEAAVTALIGYIGGDENAAGDGRAETGRDARDRIGSKVKSVFGGIAILILIILFITNPSLALWLLINILSGGRGGGRGGWGGGGGFSGGGGRSGGGGASGGW